MLLIDLIELVSFHRSEQVGKFDRADPARLQDDPDAGYEGVKIRDLSSTFRNSGSETESLEDSI